MTESGRVVLLDFGIVADVSPQVRQQRTRTIMGTIPYMAPEQAAGSREVGPAADFYALGVVLYLALTGVMPYRGSPLDVLAAKQRTPPPPPHSLVPAVPHDLDRLCMALLSIDPASRPSGSEILQRLRLQQTAEERSRAALPSVFIGRRAELAALKEALASTQAGIGTTLLLYGESGIGKSFLVRSFTSSVVQENPDAVVLAGRCYERESVPFKAVDSVIDQLSEYLMSLPPSHAEVLLPKQMGALAQVFPILSRLAARQTAGQDAGGLPADLFELRRIAFVALRTLLQRLAVERTLVLVVDDLQWADADSLALLEELLRQPLPPPMLLLATVRTTSTSPDALTEATRLRCLAAGVQQLHVAKLPDADARELVWQLLASVATEPSPAEAAALAAEAAGHPLFIDELVRQHLLQNGAAMPRLDDALWARVRRLPQPAQQLLELVAVAGVPIPLRVAAQAAVIDGERFDSLAALLRTAHLVRTTGVHMQDSIEPYHDRLRESVVAHLSAEARAQWHGRLAVALERDEAASPEELLRHWLESGNRERAADYALRAAAQAESKLAFERAAQCYEQALSLRPVEGAERTRLYTKLGEALAHASRGPASAEAFLHAMAASSSNDALRLKQRAAEQLLRSGHIDRGVALLRELLAALGLRYAETPREALLQLLWYRARLRLRGLRFVPRPESQIPAEELLRMDVCRAAAESLSLIDLIRGTVFRAQFMLLALQAGEPRRIMLGTLLEASILTSGGPDGEPLAAPVMALSKQLAATNGSPQAAAMVLLSEASIAHNLGRWRQGRELFDRAEAELRERCTGVAWEVSTARYFSIRCSFYLGELKRVAERLDGDLDEAAARGDLYMEICLRTTAVPRLQLVDDRPDATRQGLEGVIRLMGARDYPIQKYYLCNALVDLDLYEGQGEVGYQRIEIELKRLRDRYLLRVQVLRIAVADQQARCALQVASAKQGSERRHWLALAEKACASIAQEHAPWAQPLARRHGAALCALRGERERALKLCDVAAAELAAMDLRVYADSLRYAQGLLMGGEAGAALVAQAEKELRLEGVKAPARWSTAMHPGLVSLHSAHSAELGS